MKTNVTVPCKYTYHLHIDKSISRNGKIMYLFALNWNHQLHQVFLNHFVFRFKSRDFTSDMIMCFILLNRKNRLPDCSVFLEIHL